MENEINIKEITCQTALNPSLTVDIQKKAKK